MINLMSGCRQCLQGLIQRVIAGKRYSNKEPIRPVIVNGQGFINHRDNANARFSGAFGDQLFNPCGERAQLW